MVAMKVRSCVLVACMLVVPALALFSHLTPPPAREFLRCAVCDPLCQVIDAIETTLMPGSAATPARGRTLATTANPMPPTGTPQSRDETVTVVESLPVATVSSPSGASLPTAVPLTDRDAPRSQAEWETLATLRQHLTALGAAGVDCRPQPGGLPGYASSCRIGIDADGQLHRMFHGQGVDAPTAMRSLVDQIQAWRAQQAGSTRQRF